MNRAFSFFDWKNGKIADLDENFPSYLSSWTEKINMVNDGTHYIMVVDGPAILKYNGVYYWMTSGMYASVPGECEIKNGKGLIATRKDYKGMFNIGGPAEQEGRLKYIDGCTDSVLIHPPKIGDPCVNLLYFPPGIDQTPHTHPSIRVGTVLSGHGRCHYWEDGIEKTVDLVPGMIWCIHTDGVHKFSTPYGAHLRVMPYHPDSDTGPNDEDHPMLNRTMVNGISASKIDEIRTK